MLNRLYVFAIGGSGERVLKSLAMILATGMPIQANEVIPVIVDNDEKSAALEECKQIFSAYGNKEGDNGVHTIYEKAFGSDNTKWPSFCHTHLREPILLNVAGQSIGTLENIIKCPQLSDRNSAENNDKIRAIMAEKDLLFTKDDLDMPLTVGFVGNPNIGSVVLNSLSFTDPNFDTIYRGISSSDGVIVIGSLFGGTGAAGFPLIINTFNTIKDPTKKPLLGGVAILPYFDTNKAHTVDTNVVINRQKWDVDSDTFATKTRAALMYYDDYMSRQDLDFLYYVGDDKHRLYNHSVGGSNQNNPANLVELLSALSVINFAKNTKQLHTSTTFKRPVWGFEGDQDKVSNVSGITNPELKKAIVKFQLLELILKNESFVKVAIGNNSPFVKEPQFTEDVRSSIVYPECNNSSFATGLKILFQKWDQWMKELSDDEASRLIQIFNSSIKSNEKNITQNFYAAGEFGIARVEERSTGFFGLGNRINVAVEPKILETMNDIYMKIDKDLRTNIPEYRTIPLFLMIASKALDKILDEKCAI